MVYLLCTSHARTSVIFFLVARHLFDGHELRAFFFVRIPTAHMHKRAIEEGNEHKNSNHEELERYKRRPFGA